MCGQSKLKALVANIVVEHIKGIEETDMSDMLCMCKTQWYIMGMLIIITLGMLHLVINKIRKSSFFKGHMFSNNKKNITLYIQYPLIHTYKTVQSSGKYSSI